MYLDCNDPQEMDNRRRFASALTATPDVATILARYFCAGILNVLLEASVSFVQLAPGTRYIDASPDLRGLEINVDGWQLPPAGLYVVNERTVYLREIHPMSVIHEGAHAIDNALGGNGYLSSRRFIQREFASATCFVNSYAASAADEWIAEGIRFWVGAPSIRIEDHPSPQRLKEIDPGLYEIIESILAPIQTPRS